MVMIIPEAPKQRSFGSLFGEKFGAGIGQGVASTVNKFVESKIEGKKQKSKQDLINQIEQGSKSRNKSSDFSKEFKPDSKSIGEEFENNFINALPEVEKQLGRDLQPKEIDQLWENYQSKFGQQEEQQGTDNVEDHYRKAKQYAALGEHDLARQEMDQAKIESKQSTEEKKYHREVSGKYLAKVNEKAESIPEREAALQTAFSAIESGQMTPFGGDFWADVTGINALRSVSGAMLQGAAKTNLIGSLNRMPGARPNQFIEKQIDSAFAKAGESQEAQKAKLLLAQAVLDMDKNQAEMANQIAKNQRSKHGHALETIAEETNDAVKNYNEHRMQELAYDMRENMEKEMGLEEMSKLKDVPKGTPLTYEMKEVLMQEADQDPNKALKLAERLGYTIPDVSFYQR